MSHLLAVVELNVIGKDDPDLLRHQFQNLTGFRRERVNLLLGKINPARIAKSDPVHHKEYVEKQKQVEYEPGSLT